MMRDSCCVPHNINDLENTAAILKSKKNELDMDYIEQWATRLELSSVWKEMLDNVS